MKLVLNILAGGLVAFFVLACFTSQGYAKQTFTKDPDSIERMKAVPPEQIRGIECEGFRLNAEYVSPCVLRLTLQNRTNQILQLAESHPRYDFRIIVQDLRGERVPTQARYLVVTARIVRRVQPGEQLVYEYPLDKAFDVAAYSGYQVILARWVPKLDGQGMAEVVSNTVVVYPRDLEQMLAQQVAPGEFGRFKDAASRGYDVSTARAVIDLTMRTQSFLETSTESEAVPPVTDTCASIAKRLAWEYAIDTYIKTQDEEAKNLIIRKWDESLTRDSYMRWQIAALKEKWDEAFLTSTFTNLFLQSTDSMVIHEIAQALGAHGEDDEEALLNEKKNLLLSCPLPDRKAQESSLSNIDTALRKIDYWRKGDLERAGPATIPPK